MQFQAINVFEQDAAIFILPCRLEETPPAKKVFDTTFSMGVLYHQRDPLKHLHDLQTTIRSGGQLVLETLYLPGDDLRTATPEARYARMRNVWSLPTVPQLLEWLRETSYVKIELIDTSVTTTDEQRSTEWMTFESLEEALDPGDPSKTIEGWPAPHRVVVTAVAP
jgi:tRNA (mo5U34)-methyltransferase